MENATMPAVDVIVSMKGASVIVLNFSYDNNFCYAFFSRFLFEIAISGGKLRNAPVTLILRSRPD